ncbi:MAG: MarR family winged helix-turn-helix transcriptional regulator [Aureliella sp.]
MRNNAQLDRRAIELGHVVHEIIKRFEGANAVAANGPHADLTMQETRVVELLGESGGQMMRAVADHLGIAVNSVTSLADNMERKGLLRRVRSEADRRVVHVELTPAGQRASRSVMDVKTQFHREMLAALTDEEQDILLVLLRKIGGLRGPAEVRGQKAASIRRAGKPAANSERVESGRGELSVASVREAAKKQAGQRPRSASKNSKSR